ncbi:MAG: hypothetical protein GX267_03715 [Fibrobacter sp.]|jgi:TolB-like protein|nr:hypothetical protein [Fibrobacter sp.]
MNLFSPIYAINFILIAFISNLFAQSSLAILPFNSSGISTEEARQISEKFRAEFTDLRKYNVLDRQTMETLLADQGFDLNDPCRNNYCALTLGQLLSVDNVILGNIGKIDKTFAIDIKIIDISSGSVLKDISTRHTVKPVALFKKIIPELVRELVSTTSTSSIQVYKKKGRAIIPVTIITLGSAALAVPVYFLCKELTRNEPETRELKVQW